LEGRYGQNWDGCVNCWTGGAGCYVCGVSGDFRAVPYVDESGCERRVGERLEEGVLGGLYFEWVDYCELLKEYEE